MIGQKNTLFFILRIFIYLQKSLISFKNIILQIEAIENTLLTLLYKYFIFFIFNDTNLFSFFYYFSDF